MDPEAFGFLPKKVMQNGLPVKNPALRTADGKKRQKQALNNLLGAIAEISGGKKNIKKLQEMQRMKKDLNAYADNLFFNSLTNNKALAQRFLDEANRVSDTRYERCIRAFRHTKRPIQKSAYVNGQKRFCWVDENKFR